MRRLLAPLLIAFCSVAAGAPAAAQDREVPYWATLRAEEVNMRVGPSERYPIAWVYHRVGLPVKVIRMHEGWRLVRDPDGAQGWMVARLLNPERGAIVTGKDTADMRDGSADDAQLLWKLKPGISGKLGDCRDGWCKFDSSGRRGWVKQDRLWGAGTP
ncbi:MAG: hypothetical protein RLZZ08_1943 [Pseudomonadota bacterium]|jgi:SH3-like domain-containing protein